MRHLDEEEALWLQAEDLVVSGVLHHLLQTEKLDGTHRLLIPPEDAHLELSRLSADTSVISLTKTVQKTSAPPFTFLLAGDQTLFC